MRLCGVGSVSQLEPSIKRVIKGQVDLCFSVASSPFSESTDVVAGEPKPLAVNYEVSHHSMMLNGVSIMDV